LIKSTVQLGRAFKELIQYRQLLYMITYRDIKVRYKQSIMGVLWAVLMPIMIVISGVVVRYVYAIAAHAPLKTADIASVAVKSLPWAFVVASIRFSCYSLTNNANLVTKIAFPKEIFPIGAVLASLFDFVIAAAGLIVFLIIGRIGVGPNLLWAPVLLAIVILMVTGVGMFVAAASLFLRDVKFIVEVFLTFGIFFTPVFFDASMFGKNGKWLMLNPLSPVLDGLGACVARHQAPNLPWVAYSAAFAVFSIVAGYSFFKHLEPAFAENI
jgi:lipopolysaccharide transport system permease protein